MQSHHVPALGLVKGPGHPDPAVQVAPARARDLHPLAEERALGAASWVLKGAHAASASV